MNLPTIFYFISVLLTLALTGFLAWYSWRQPAGPGVRAYAGLALGECLLALVEIFSMASATLSQAHFWFNVRFLFSGTISVLFLIFALEYFGREDWLSKPLLLVAFIIPALSQVFIWVNGLQGLWVKQDVSFQQVGRFWMVDTSTRILAAWFLVHSLYSLALLLAGMVVILLAAWRMRREQLGQALLLLAGALVALVASLIPVFNLFPQLGFNPFIPGIGLSALLYALAIFQFQFLKYSPVQAVDASIARFQAQEKRSLSGFILIFILFAVGIAVVGFETYQRYQDQFRTQVEAQLTGVAALKMNQLETWRAERLGDARIFYNNPVFTEMVQAFLGDPGDAQATAQLQVWLAAIQNGQGYERVYLLDIHGEERLAAPNTTEPASAYLAGQAVTVMGQGQITFMDFYRDTPSSPIRLALLVPIYAEGMRSRPLGVLVLRIDPTASLYPFIQQWPTPSTSAETLLVRRDGNNVVYLNDLRFEPDAALNLRIPLADSQVLAVKVILGQTGVVHGLDYRGVPVIGYVGAVPNSPWFLVARMDTSEMYAPLYARLWETLLFFGVLILAVGAGLGLLWRQQGLRFYRRQVEAANALLASQTRFRTLFENMLNGFAYCRMIFEQDRPQDFVYLEVNRAFETLTGLQGVVGRKVSEVIPGIQASDPELLERYGRVALTGVPETFENYVEALKMWFAISVYCPQKGYFVAVFDVITGRKRAEQSLQEYNLRLETEVAKRTRELQDAQEKMVRQERLATLGQLAGSVGHELRNPLGVISNAVYYLKMTQPDANPTIRDYLDIIEKETRTSDKIITDLLDFTRLKSVNREPVSVPDLLAQTLKRFPVPDSVEMVCDLPPDLPPVYADRGHIVQVLGNLVTNACQAIALPDGTPQTGKIDFSARLQGDMIVIRLQDSGAGIPPENMAKLFEPLFTTKTKGIGLGLAVSQRLIEANGGRIEARSEPGQGSTFTIFLPIYQEQSKNKIVE
jgi:signal transduction histidine kinase